MVRTADHANYKKLDILGDARITGQLDVVASGLSVAGHVNVGLGISVTTKSYFSTDVDIYGPLTVESPIVKIQGPKLELGYNLNTDASVDGGGIQITGNTNKEILWKTNNNKWNISHGLELTNQDSTISMGSTDVLTKNTVLGNTIGETINLDTPLEMFYPQNLQSLII